MGIKQPAVLCMMDGIIMQEMEKENIPDMG